MFMGKRSVQWLRRGLPSGLVIVLVVVSGFLVGALLGAPEEIRADPGEELAQLSYGGISFNDGVVDEAGAPDLIEVADHDGGIAGYARKADVFPPASQDTGRVGAIDIPVFDHTGDVLVGYLVPDHGFVSIDAYRVGDHSSETVVTWVTHDGAPSG